ncbi:MAG: hypothetical protein HUU57_08050 [Bdellovibrio sp.]|nr:hypothetical protein [Bdellovibrio sp.]
MKSILILFCLFFSFSSVAGAQGVPSPLPDDSYPDPGTPPPSSPGNPGNPNYPPPHPGEPPPWGNEIPYTLGTGQTDKSGSRTFAFFPRRDLSRIIKIRLVGFTNNIEIEQVRIVAMDGSYAFVTPMNGRLGAGSMREVYINGRALNRIEIKASPSYFWKNPGSFRVDVTAIR